MQMSINCNCRRQAGSVMLISSERAMQPNDIVTLSVLGVVHSAPVPVDRIVEAAKEIAPDDWQPTAEMVLSVVRSAKERRWIDFDWGVPLSREPHLAITEIGRGVLRDLLTKPLPVAASGFARTCMAVKISFLDCLDPEARWSEIERLRDAHIERLSVLRSKAARSRDRRACWRLWRDHEIDRLQWELSWLERFAMDATVMSQSDDSVRSSPERPRVAG